ncbi:FliG C-terminal domain-containing protein, partial [Vibrio parahaemolyticus]|nr:FliG C-terminal domain-containing protein [Vibrio parahaemolyticus]
FEGDRGSLMEMLKLHDEDVVNAIEENMFDFMVLGRQREETMDMLVQQIPLELWAVALKGSDITLQQAIKRSMPQRMVKALEDDMDARGAVALSRVQKARQDIMQMVRELDESGEVQLLLYEEPTVE